MNITSREERTQDYWKLLNEVVDPEIDVGIVDLGLVYNVRIENGVAYIDMTYTSIGCPAGPEIQEDVEKKMKTYPGISDVKVTIVWEPIWGPDMVDPDIRAMLWGN